MGLNFKLPHGWSILTGGEGDDGGGDGGDSRGDGGGTGAGGGGGDHSNGDDRSDHGNGADSGVMSRTEDAAAEARGEGEVVGVAQRRRPVTSPSLASFRSRCQLVSQKRWADW